MIVHEYDPRLKPCKCCGNTRVYLELNPLGWGVICPMYACNRTVVPFFPTKEEAVEHWNNDEVVIGVDLGICQSFDERTE